MSMLPADLLVAPGEVTPEPSEGPSSSRGRSSSLRRVTSAMLASPAAMLSAAFIVLIVLVAIAAPLLTKWSGWDPFQYDDTAVNPDLGGLPALPWGGISTDHWFGVEPQSGRDVFARIVYGARVSLAIAFAAAAITTIVGVVLGMLAGFFGGWVDQVISRVMDFLMAFPSLIFMIALLSALPAGNRPVLLVMVLCIFGWPYTARVIRGQTMSLGQREFVEAAQASGASKAAIVFKEILPNLTGTIIVLVTLAVPSYIGTEAALSFLGVGVVPPTPSWGQMIATAVPWYATDPMFFFVPGLFLFLTVLSFTVFGDHLSRAIDTGDTSK
ncbi:ABC transporter permease [Paeniglutamicibacter kerguelensis]|uniref:Peptide/nickel transport system permease protein n=2 Tax=Paeniglutamicibacter kerguelensis TaxID=254788 RepID=A0ABS4XGW4_9MICC|nr:ABC transporter permease [Paeniglutamicibacter kerguelensis]MBP2387586.1 peptide/nickel transport system permease protein [Paeniglutamicibacter kerguelensis]